MIHPDNTKFNQTLMRAADWAITFDFQPITVYFNINTQEYCHETDTMMKNRHDASQWKPICRVVPIVTQRREEP